jgi:hypothetical protein
MKISMRVAVFRNEGVNLATRDLLTTEPLNCHINIQINQSAFFRKKKSWYAKNKQTCVTM